MTQFLRCQQVSCIQLTQRRSEADDKSCVSYTPDPSCHEGVPLYLNW